MSSWVRLGLFFSFWLVWVRSEDHRVSTRIVLVHLGGLWVVRVRLRCRNDSSSCALRVPSFVRVRVVRPGVPWWSLGLFGFVWVMCVRIEFLWIHPGAH